MKKLKKKDLLLFTPGPVVLNPSVKNSLSLPMEHHRSLKFQNSLKQISDDLKEIFQTKQDVLILHSTGTGAMEAALSNTLSRKEEVLCVRAGKFGDRWKDIAKAFKLKVHSLKVPLGSAVSVKELEKELQKKQSA